MTTTTKTIASAVAAFTILLLQTHLGAWMKDAFNGVSKEP